MCLFCTADVFTFKEPLPSDMLFFRGIVYSFTTCDQNNDNTLTLVLQIYVWFLKC